MGALPSKHSPPDGLLRRPVRRERAACRQPNGGRVLSLAEPAPPCRTQTAAGIASRLTTSTAFAAAALVGAESGRLRSQTAIQAVWNASPHGYTPPNRRRALKRPAPRFGARFFLSKPARRAKRRAPVYTAEHTRPFASYAPRRLAALSRPTARQADIARAAIYKRIRRTAIRASLCFARSPRRKRNASSPRAIMTGPTCHKNVYSDGTNRTAASLRQASRPARGACCAIFQRTGPARFGAPTFEKSTKSLALQGFWYGAGSAAPMGRLSRRKAVLQHRRNSQRPKKEIGGSQRRESAAILETEILCKLSIGLRLHACRKGFCRHPRRLKSTQTRP